MFLCANFFWVIAQPPPQISNGPSLSKSSLQSILLGNKKVASKLGCFRDKLRVSIKQSEIHYSVKTVNLASLLTCRTLFEGVNCIMSSFRSQTFCANSLTNRMIWISLKSISQIFLINQLPEIKLIDQSLHGAKQKALKIKNIPCLKFTFFERHLSRNGSLQIPVFADSGFYSFCVLLIYESNPRFTIMDLIYFTIMDFIFYSINGVQIAFY